ncbi:arsenite efflux protein ACR3 family [Alkalihalophilus pseudofirmus OF4]|uniref:Arsenite efflux protein ACR3 family n=1 Tax=Alkalihalophilus pseudofirmus (strain ATCC BAA-2126 / JCM 17055 / OF4) TaxID=398511 RepID=D3FS26_ALKPO|nr:bile acid:sodium symporter [Alkalihalophilus pseudofirmus]ADC51661.1 arsenite efflux protein ACR3 family [Alkalihalophilus pseudofirmus OF4]
MSVIEKLYSIIILAAVILGLSLGQVDLIRIHAESLIVPFLLAMLYITFLQIPLDQLKKAFKNIKFTSTSLLLNFVWTPVFAWLLAMIFLSDHPALYIGFIMLMVTPCTDWYLIFTGIAKGNVALSTAILPLNLVLQVVLLPIYLILFAGSSGVVEFSFLVESVLIVLLLPLLLAVLTNLFLKKRKALQESLLNKLSTIPIVLLSLAIMAMFAAHGQLLLEHLDLLWIILLPILLFFIVNFFISQKAGKLLKFSYRDCASLSMTTLARNSPLALAIAMTAFPDEPFIALILVIGPLLELPILAVFSQILLLLSKKTKTD